jgi:hypothetical protein
MNIMKKIEQLKKSITFEDLVSFMYENERIFKEETAEADRQRKENERLLNEKFAETDRRMKETDRLFKEQAAERERERKERERERKERERERKERERERKERERERKETDRLIKENAKRMKELQKELGGMGNSHGSFAEEYFFNSFEDGEQNFFGEKFDEIEKNVKPKEKGLKDEYDIVMYNGTSVAIVEVKFKADNEDIQDVLKKAKTFRVLCPSYQNYKIYLGLASFSFPSHIEKACIKQGIAVIKQVGDNVVINDARLKVF